MNVLPTPAFLFGAGVDEWALLGVIVFLLFGPRRLPEIARSIGRLQEKLRRTADEFRVQLARLDEPLPAPPPQPMPRADVEPGAHDKPLSQESEFRSQNSE